MTSDGQKPIINVRFPPSLAEAMRELARKNGETPSEWLRRVAVQEIVRCGGTVTCPACKRPYEAHDK